MGKATLVLALVSAMRAFGAAAHGQGIVGGAVGAGVGGVNGALGIRPRYRRVHDARGYRVHRHHYRCR